MSSLLLILRAGVCVCVCVCVCDTEVLWLLRAGVRVCVRVCYKMYLCTYIHIILKDNTYVGDEAAPDGYKLATACTCVCV